MRDFVNKWVCMSKAEWIKFGFIAKMMQIYADSLYTASDRWMANIMFGFLFFTFTITICLGVVCHVFEVTQEFDC